MQLGWHLGKQLAFFLVAFCASKFLNLEDASPIQHIEHFWSGKPEDRTSLISQDLRKTPISSLDLVFNSVI